MIEARSAELSSLPEYQLERLVNAVGFARTRCLSTLVLIHRACDVTDTDHGSVIRVLQERELEANEQELLESLILTAVSDDVRAGLPTHLRSVTDRLASNLGQLLPDGRARYLASQLVQHRLRARRRAATKLLRRVGVTEDEAAGLRHAVLTYCDPDALELLARIPDAFCRGDCCGLTRIVRVREHDVDFLTAMIITRLWKDGELDHQHAAANHPLSYIRAMGRAGGSEQIDRLISIIDETAHPELISMCASVAGRLQSKSAVCALEQKLRDLKGDYSVERRGVLEWVTE